MDYLAMASEGLPPSLKDDSRGNGHKTEPPPLETEGYSRSDYGMARRFIDRHGEIVRYCHGHNRWLVWDGKRWQPDADAAVIRMAKETVKAMYAELAGFEDAERRRDFFKFIVKSEADAKIMAMLSSAESEIEAAITPLVLDADPWLFNCENGTLDLRTGKLRPHRQGDMITKIAPVVYDPDARSDLWVRFLKESTGDDPDLIRFLARATGYTLTGDTREENLFFVHGPTNTGKSTFLEALKATMGDYALTSDFETFLARSFVGAARPDIARLAGARFVVSIEVDEGKKLAQGLVKQLTGRDTINARELYQRSFDFMPQFKLWLAANHAPEVRHDDDAMWRRILRVPFDVTVPKEKRDPTLKARLKDDPAERSAILAWAVNGCMDWQRNGLGVPPRVELATDEYRKTQDPLRDFIEGYCVLSENIWTPASDLREVYERWAKESGAEILRAHKWMEALTAHGCESERRRRSGILMRGWRGIGLMTDYEDGVPTQDKLEQSDELPF